MSASPAQTERASLCDLLLALGPDAPTLCEGWTTADMAAHLVVRERNPLAGLGIVLSPLAGYTAKAMAAERRRRSFDATVERIRNGPPYPMRLVDDLVNTNEYFVHHEDVRRGDGDTTPRQDIDGVERALWSALRRAPRLAVRQIRGVGIELVWPGEDPLIARAGESTATIAGTPGEIVLYLMGRRSAAHVELTGDPAAIAVVEGADLGI